ncbi:MAG TPA: hypothetical protein DCM64_03625, partial [Gammaproteobacteria bacterium]|nr:MFS transporter [Gammaproteobacteria bacterium]HAJ75525.1 hypothetical protein [Gammaproteobacteria bacterium]
MSTKASKSSLIFYGIGNLSPAIKGNFLGAPVFYYYNNVLGLEAWLVSLALALALAIDGITDPLVGYYSDYTRSRWGRRHPYIYAGILPGALCYFFLIMADFGSTQTQLFCQLFLLITLLRIAWTFYQVPREALGAEISKDYGQRTQMHGLSSLFGWIGGAGIYWATQAVFLGDSYDNLDGYHALARWGSGLILITGLIFAIGTSREIPRLEPPRSEVPATLKEIWREILDTLNHRSWLMLFSAGVVFAVFVGLTSGLTFYFNSFFWDWKPSDIAIFALIDLMAAMFISAMAGPLAARFDKKRLAVTLFILAIAVGPILLILRLLDIWYGISILPPNGEKFGPLWWVMMVHSLVSASIGVLAFILVGSMTADVVEDSQTKTGKRSEGLFFAGPHLIQKSMSGIGFMIKGMILTLVGFSATASQADKVLAIQDLALMIVILNIILPSISLYLFSRYEITRSKHESNLGELGYKEET